jgi:Mce-associated membrane protein
MATRPELDEHTRRLLGGALVVLLLLAVAVSGWQGWRMASDEPATASTAGTAGRDAAIKAADEALLAFNSIDYRRIDPILDGWSELSSGKLHASVTAGRKAVRREVTRARTVTSARVVRSALTSYDDGAGTATVVAVLAIRSQTEGGKAKTKHTRFAGLLQRSGSSWKLSAMQTLQAQTMEAQS